ncbi:hypothetical protein [Microbacterium sp. NPDC058389]|uniref:hypothetical protein n=1 Tax=Microbacterium sp. NPDC058389 TaxID=3346475 RepID=UPI00365F6D91
MSKKKRRAHSGSDHLATFLIALVFVVPISAMVAAALFVPRTDELVMPAEKPSYMRIHKADFLDSRPVNLQLHWVDGTDLLAPAWSGTVTEVAVGPGQAVSTGSRVLRVDGVWRIAAHTDWPFFGPVSKDSAPGDVAAVNGLLASLGYSYSQGGWNSASLKGVRQLAVDLGVAGASQIGAFDPSWVIWIPADSVTVAAPLVSPGSIAPAAGQPVLSTPPRLSLVEVATSAPEGLPEDHEGWILSLKGLAVPFDGARIDAVDTLASFEGALGATGVEEVEARVERKEAVVGWQVPTSAVVVDADGNTCLARRSNGTEPDVVRVEVLSGSVGTARVDGQLSATDDVLVNPASVGTALQCS